MSLLHVATLIKELKILLTIEAYYLLDENPQFILNHTFYLGQDLLDCNLNAKPSTPFPFPL